MTDPSALPMPERPLSLRSRWTADDFEPEFFKTHQERLERAEICERERLYALALESRLADFESERTIEVPFDVALTVRRAFLPTNPNKMRRAHPDVVDAARRFIHLVESDRTIRATLDGKGEKHGEAPK